MPPYAIDQLISAKAIAARVEALAREIADHFAGTDKLVVAGLLLQHPEEYPQGWFCTPKGTVKHGQQTPDRPCHCVRMDYDTHCEGVPTESSLCLQWCHKQHCACPVTCAPGQGPQPDPECQ